MYAVVLIACDAGTNDPRVKALLIRIVPRRGREKRQMAKVYSKKRKSAGPAADKRVHPAARP